MTEPREVVAQVLQAASEEYSRTWWDTAGTVLHMLTEAGHTVRLEEVTETEFRVGYDSIMEVYYVEHAPLHCDWEHDLGRGAPTFADIRTAAEAHEQECSKRSDD